MRKKLICASMVIALILSLLLPMSALAAEEKVSPVVAAKSAVVRVYAGIDGEYWDGSAFGVGEIGATPQYFVTNAHCVMDDAGQQLADEVYILLDDNAVTYSFNKNDIVEEKQDFSKMVRCDVVNSRTISLYPDVAVLKAEKPIEGRTTLPIRKSLDGIVEATSVHALGFPGELDLLTVSKHGANLLADIEDVSVNSGNITKITNAEAYENTKVIIHTAQIAHGNSGGPLIDDTGTVIGINTYGLNLDTQRYISVAIDYASEILDEHHIPYTGPDSKATMPLKTIILAAIIAIIVVVTVILILSFRKSGKKYLEAQEERETKELRLQGVSGYFTGRRFPIDGQITIGRAPSNNIIFPTTTEGVSSNHCVIVKNGDQLYIKDANSSYGTYINGEKRIPPNQLITLKVGDKIALGSEREAFMITRKGGKI